MKSITLKAFRQALEAGEITAFYQPQYDANTGQMVGAEALARWVTKDQKQISPADFIPVLETSTAINELDWTITEFACKTIQELGTHAVPISVNFSRWHALEADFIDNLQSILQTYHVKKELFHIEITESAFALEQEQILPWVKSIHEAGFTIALDDFGSGLSSIQTVTELPIDILKFDRSLLTSNCESEKERIALESLFYFANRLHIDTVAEGVETTAQLKFLQTCDCKKIQGFLFDTPLDKETFLILACGNSHKLPEKLDIIDIQSESSASNMLLEATFTMYPLIILANLSKNSYYMMTYDNFTQTECAPSGNFDELILHGAKTMHRDDQERFKKTFSRSNLLKLKKEGYKTVSLITNQLGDDGIYRKVETTDLFIKNSASEDVLVISLNRNI